VSTEHETEPRKKRSKLLHKTKDGLPGGHVNKLFVALVEAPLADGVWNKNTRYNKNQDRSFLGFKASFQMNKHTLLCKGHHAKASENQAIFSPH